MAISPKTSISPCKKEHENCKNSENSQREKMTLHYLHYLHFGG